MWYDVLCATLVPLGSGGSSRQDVLLGSTGGPSAASRACRRSGQGSGVALGGVAYLWCFGRALAGYAAWKAYWRAACKAFWCKVGANFSQQVLEKLVHQHFKESGFLIVLADFSFFESCSIQS